MTALERRYRRLLGLYPPEHRERYEQEMLAVLLDGAEPGRSRPTVRETVDLVCGAFAYRARVAAGDYGTGPWRRTAGLVALVAVAAMAAQSVSDLLWVVGPWLGYGFADRPPAGPSVWVPPLAWCLAVLASLTGLRRAAAGLAGLGLLLNLGVLGLRYHRMHGFAQVSMWELALATVAVVGLLWTRDLRDGLRLLGWRRGVAVAGLLGWFVLGRYVLAAVERWLPIHIGYPGWEGLVGSFGPVELAVLVLAVLSIGLERPIRRRLFSVVAVLGVAGLMELAMGGAYPGWPQLPALVQVALFLPATALGFALAASAVHRRERGDEAPAPLNGGG